MAISMEKVSFFGFDSNPLSSSSNIYTFDIKWETHKPLRRMQFSNGHKRTDPAILLGQENFNAKHMEWTSNMAAEQGFILFSEMS